MQNLIYFNYSRNENDSESYSNVLGLLQDKTRYAVIVEPASRTEEDEETSFIKHLKYMIGKNRIGKLYLLSLTHISLSRTQLREFLMHCKRSEVSVESFFEPWLIMVMEQQKYADFFRQVTKEINALPYLSGILPIKPRTRKGIYITT